MCKTILYILYRFPSKHKFDVNLWKFKSFMRTGASSVYFLMICCSKYQFLTFFFLLFLIAFYSPNELLMIQYLSLSLALFMFSSSFKNHHHLLLDIFFYTHGLLIKKCLKNCFFFLLFYFVQLLSYSYVWFRSHLSPH